MNKPLQPAAQPARDDLSPADMLSLIAQLQTNASSSATRKESIVLVICLKEQIGPELPMGESTAVNFVTEDIGFLVQGEPGCVYTAASNILSVKEAFQRAGQDGTTFQTRTIYVMSLPAYQDLLDTEVPISRGSLEEFGARQVSEVQTEVEDLNRLLAELRGIGSLGTYPPSKDGIALLHFKGDLEGAGPGYQLAMESMESYPGSTGVIYGAATSADEEYRTISSIASFFVESDAGQKYADDALKMYMPFRCDSRYIGGPVLMLETFLCTPAPDPQLQGKLPSSASPEEADLEDDSYLASPGICTQWLHCCIISVHH
jgi:hypothetical protein